MEVWETEDDKRVKLHEAVDVALTLIIFLAASATIGMVAAIVGDWYYAVLARMTSGGVVLQARSHILALAQVGVIAAAIIGRLLNKKWWWA